MKALFPGSFDPVTNGHLDIIKRAANVFDELVVGVHDNPGKQVMFSAAERLEMMEVAVATIPGVTAVRYDGLTAAFARQIGAGVMVRGLRALSDFEHEFALASMNRRIDPEIETVCLVTSSDHTFVSSSMIREIAAHGQDVSDWVPPSVAAALHAKLTNVVQGSS
jgi:pantetheine-phosphate adenylyltransferase